MWIERTEKKAAFIHAVRTLKSQVLVVRGARQVGKTSFVLNAVRGMKEYPIICINGASAHSTMIDGTEYYGRDYFGTHENGDQLLQNISFQFGDLQSMAHPVIVFIDEADMHPVSLEAIQTLAGLSGKLKIIYTGSNLENIPLKNAATGRKHFFDLYPITFAEFLKAGDMEKELRYLFAVSLKEARHSEMFHNRLTGLFQTYVRLGGMPRIVDAYLDVRSRTQQISVLISDLVVTIEENVKKVLGEKSHLYEYEDVLRKLAFLSMDTLKFSRLQVQHAGRSEAKKLVNKTVGARVAHKIRLYESSEDLSKYILFDSGVLNYLLNGSDLTGQRITPAHLGIQYETVVGNELIACLPTRDDLCYWKSKRGAQTDFLLRSPLFAAIDVKSGKGFVRSLDSAGVHLKELDCLVKISNEPLQVNRSHIARIAHMDGERKIPLIVITHYLCGRFKELVAEL
jgi:predicted AAA+ superfamily ATPase